MDALRPYGGTILQTSLPRDAKQQLMRSGSQGIDLGAADGLGRGADLSGQIAALANGRPKHRQDRFTAA